MKNDSSALDPRVVGDQNELHKKSKNTKKLTDPRVIPLIRRREKAKVSREVGKLIWTKGHHPFNCTVKLLI